MTPESQGGMFRSSVELAQADAYHLTADLTDGKVTNGVNDEKVSRTSYLFNTSLAEQIDVFWSHVGGSTSLLGVKFQFMGGSRTGNATGHKMAITAAMGGNEHETDSSPKVEFDISSQEFQFLYGFRFNPSILVYSNLSYGKYSFDGKVSSSDSSINGLKPNYDAKIFALLTGLEATVGPVLGKLELGAQRLDVTDTDEIFGFFWGWSLGFSW